MHPTPQALMQRGSALLIRANYTPTLSIGQRYALAAMAYRAKTRAHELQGQMSQAMRCHRLAAVLATNAQKNGA